MKLKVVSNNRRRHPQSYTAKPLDVKLKRNIKDLERETPSNLACCVQDASKREFAKFRMVKR